MAQSSTALVLLAIVAMALSPASGGIFLRLEGIDGESQDKAHEKWIDLESVGVAAPQNTDAIAALQLRKRIDKSSPLLAKSCAKGKFLSEAEIDFTQQGGDGRSSYVGITIRDVLVASIEQQIEGDSVYELVTLQFRSIFFRYSRLGAKETAFVDLADGDDSDGDGMSDRYEKYHGFDVNVPDGDLDSDGDGYTNAEEARLGTNPRSASSGFTVRGRRNPAQNGRLEIAWKTKPGTSYDIYFTSDLATPFKYQQTLVADDVESALEIAGQSLKGFYQVREARAR